VDLLLGESEPKYFLYGSTPALREIHCRIATVLDHARPRKVFGMLGCIHKELWDQYDVDESGNLDPQEFSAILIDLSMATWIETVDPQTSLSYYYHQHSNESVWELPDSNDLLAKFLHEQGIVDADAPL
jgi:hypothetical protein